MSLYRWSALEVCILNCCISFSGIEIFGTYNGYPNVMRCRSYVFGVIGSVDEGVMFS